MRLLYIEDDEIDVLALKRLLRGYENITLDVCTHMRDLESKDFADYDAIISDSNLPDGSYKELRELLPARKTQFISGSGIDGLDVWIKPITKAQLETVVKKGSLINLSYIKDLAAGDDAYEQDMIEIAKRILPQRYEELVAAKNSLEALKAAAHKTKSSYRVCGMNNAVLADIENLSPSDFNDINLKNRLLDSVRTQVDAALEELNHLSPQD